MGRQFLRSVGARSARTRTHVDEPLRRCVEGAGWCEQRAGRRGEDLRVRERERERLKVYCQTRCLVSKERFSYLISEFMPLSGKAAKTMSLWFLWILKNEMLI